LLRNSILLHIIEGKIERRIEVTERRGRRRISLQDTVKGKKGYRRVKDEILKSRSLDNWLRERL
jgi:hypothetical protein